MRGKGIQTPNIALRNALHDADVIAENLPDLLLRTVLLQEVCIYIYNPCVNEYLKSLTASPAQLSNGPWKDFLLAETLVFGNKTGN